MESLIKLSLFSPKHQGITSRSFSPLTELAPPFSSPPSPDQDSLLPPGLPCPPQLSSLRQLPRGLTLNGLALLDCKH